MSKNNLTPYVFKKRMVTALRPSLITLVALGYSLHVQAANPASTDYVNQRVNAVLAQLEAQINAIPAGSQGSQGVQGARGEQGLPGSYSAGEGITINEGIIQSTLTHHIGEHYQGGIVFFVDDTGLHGLIAAITDVSPGIQWQNGEGGEKVVNAQGNGIGAGELNTRLIIAEQTIDDQQGLFAALVAANFTTNAAGEPCPPESVTPVACYGGWTLPSIYELGLMQLNLANQGLGDLTATYWSSTEAGVTEAWAYDFNSSAPLKLDKSNEAPRVKPIRAF